MISVENWWKMLQCNRDWSFSLRWKSQQNHSVISDVIKNSCMFSFLAWSFAFFDMPWLPVTVSILLSSLTGRDRSHRGKGGERRSCMCFSPLWHLPHCCMTVINRGALPQGQPGAAVTIGVKGQKVSDIGGRRSAQCLGLFVLHRVCSQEAEGGTGGGNSSNYAIIRQNSSDFSSQTSCRTIV